MAKSPSGKNQAGCKGDTGGAGRALFSVRIPATTIARVKAYSIATGRKNQDIAEAALEKYMRELRLAADEERKVKALLGQ